MPGILLAPTKGKGKEKGKANSAPTSMHSPSHMQLFHMKILTDESRGNGVHKKSISLLALLARKLSKDDRAISRDLVLRTPLLLQEKNRSTKGRDYF